MAPEWLSKKCQTFNSSDTKGLVPTPSTKGGGGEGSEEPPPSISRLANATNLNLKLSEVLGYPSRSQKISS